MSNIKKGNGILTWSPLGYRRITTRCKWEAPWLQRRIILFDRVEGLVPWSDLPHLSHIACFESLLSLSVPVYFPTCMGTVGAQGSVGLWGTNCVELGCVMLDPPTAWFWCRQAPVLGSWESWKPALTPGGMPREGSRSWDTQQPPPTSSSPCLGLLEWVFYWQPSHILAVPGSLEVRRLRSPFGSTSKKRRDLELVTLWVAGNNKQQNPEIPLGLSSALEWDD